MARTLEVGRAVLALPATNLELWLTTFITVSSSQHCSDMQHSSTSFLLDFLSSGSVWIGRGTGLHMDLELTLRGEPLSQSQLQELTHHILEAPVWDQLMLQPSLLVDTAFTHGKASIGIRHSEKCEPTDSQKSHRFFAKVVTTELKPPESVPSIDIDAIRLSMEILESRQQTAVKRSRTSTNLRLSDPARLIIQANTKENVRACHQYVPVEAATNTYYTLQCALQSQRSAASRNWSQDEIEVRIVEGNIPTPASSQECDFEQPVIVTDSRKRTTPSDDDSSDIRVMVDAAFRLTTCGAVPKISNGLKLKANTFRVSLADIAPSLWRPGYLHALSQRVSLLPTIGHSMIRVAERGTISASLSRKIATLNAQRSADKWTNKQHYRMAAENFASLPLTVIDRLWLFLQKNIPSRSASSLQSFVASDETILYCSDEILEPSTQVYSQSCANNVEHKLYCLPATQHDETRFRQGESNSLERTTVEAEYHSAYAVETPQFSM